MCDHQCELFEERSEAESHGAYDLELQRALNPGCFHCGLKRIDLGLGQWPSHDPWGNELTGHRKAKAGKPIPKRGILEGIQCDQDYLRLVFGLQTGPSRQQVCHYCNAIQWIDSRKPVGPGNHPDELYTVFGPNERVEMLESLTVSTFKIVLVFNLNIGMSNPSEDPEPGRVDPQAWRGSTVPNRWMVSVECAGFKEG